LSKLFSPRILSNKIFCTIYLSISNCCYCMQTIKLLSFSMLINSRFIIIKICIYLHSNSNWPLLSNLLFNFFKIAPNTFYTIFLSIKYFIINRRSLSYFTLMFNFCISRNIRISFLYLYSFLFSIC